MPSPALWGRECRNRRLIRRCYGDSNWGHISVKIKRQLTLGVGLAVSRAWATTW